MLCTAVVAAVPLSRPAEVLCPRLDPCEYLKKPVKPSRYDGVDRCRNPRFGSQVMIRCLPPPKIRYAARSMSTEKR